MARNRMIKPSFWSSRTLMRVSRDARLLFIGLWNFADDYGILENSNRRILGDVFPYDEKVLEVEIKKWKGELLKENLIVEIQFNGHSYLYIRSWNEHQKVAHPAKGFLPSDVTPESLMSSSGDSPAQIEVEREVEVKVKIETSKNNLDGEIFEENSNAIILAKLLWSLILENNPKAKVPNFQKWAGEVEKMLRIDGRTFEEVEFMIHWSQQDNFWKANILSTAKLREKFDQLFVKAKSQYEKQQVNDSKTAFIS